MVKIEKCKIASFSTGKFWIFLQKHPKGAIFSKYNIIIPISKCKDDFSPNSGKNHLFSASKELLYRLDKNLPVLVGMYTLFWRFPAWKEPPPSGWYYNVCTVQGQLLQIAKKISIIRVNFQHNIVLIFQQFLWYDSLAKYGDRKLVFMTFFSDISQIFPNLYERGMQLWLIWI